MSKITIIKFAKKAKQVVKRITGEDFTPYVSWCRRIDRVKASERVCAMTFDDGPMKLPPSNGGENSLSETLLSTLEKFNAKGTFDVIGTTRNNYPDTEGEIGTPSWSGVRHDHYPAFNKDDYAGVFACPEIVDRIISHGHEVTNHTWSHVLYGRKNIIYSKRHHFEAFADVKEDLLKLHETVSCNFNYRISLSRPPHYVDKISNRLTAYDLYALVGYQYMGASFDGAGWLPCSSYDEEVEAMTAPLKNTLEKNADALSGQIIFQKDGYNMALRTPVADGLEKQLEILSKYGYSVITVSELLEKYPFSDIGENDEDFHLFKELVKTNAILYTDNTLRPDTLMTKGELAMFLSPREESVNKRIDALLKNKKKIGTLPSQHPYSGAWDFALRNNLFSERSFKPGKKLSLSDFENLKDFFDIEKLTNKPLTRRNVFRAYCKK